MESGICSYLLVVMHALLSCLPRLEATGQRMGQVPDEQRLYRDLMMSYESSVRPVINASDTLTVHFKLTLNQIVDLDERTQVLTTNVFIDQHWTDEKLCWNSSEYNGIRTLRVPAAEIWLPDTFIFNNADDGATGFMQGVYVLLNSNGSILWPVPVKLKSSCKVDIRYFPFDDQECLLRFGSWIYSGRWMDFRSTTDGIDLSYYIDNSEWDLVDIDFQKKLRQVQFGAVGDGFFVENSQINNDNNNYNINIDNDNNSSSNNFQEYHPDLVYTLHIRRRTFYYIFNIIVPCVMLSVLTLLTFWLPPTSGEKISLGLSVFLAFSMFMLLIAEEVPATSESVPLIGVYLTTVMTLTSTSVIMAVLVINLYNRGGKTSHPPTWLLTLVLDGVARLFCMKFDIEKLAKGLDMDETEKIRYKCPVHPPHKSRGTTPRASRAASRRNTEIGAALFQTRKSLSPYDVISSARSRLQTLAVPNEILFSDISTNLSSPEFTHKEAEEAEEDPPEDEAEEIWVRRDSMRSRKESLRKGASSLQTPESIPLRSMSLCFAEEPCKKQFALLERKRVIVEWQSVATVIDRVLFWLFLVGTAIAYIVILVIVPHTKPHEDDSWIKTRAVNKFW